MEKTPWVAEADKQAKEIFDALNAKKEQDEELRFANLTRLVHDWCSKRLGAKGVEPDEMEDCLLEVQRRLRSKILHEQAQGQPLQSVYKTLTPIVLSVATDILRKTQPNYRRMKRQLAIVCEQGTLFTTWTHESAVLIGHSRWKNKPFEHNKPFDEWHQENIRLQLNERLAALPEKKLGEQLMLLLEITFETYAAPLPVKEFEVLSMDLLRLKVAVAPTDPNKMPEIDAGVDVEGETIEKVVFAGLKEQIQEIVSSMSARSQEVLLLSLEADTLAIYCAPETPPGVLTSLHQEAFNLLPQQAATLALEDTHNVPIPDAEIGKRIGITANNVGVLRRRIRKRIIEIILKKDLPV